MGVPKLIVGTAPTHVPPAVAPLAVHDVALVVDHVNSDVCPVSTVLGTAANATILAGAGGALITLTTTEFVALAPPPVHVNV
jgi:hypothetical protein